MPSRRPRIATVFLGVLAWSTGAGVVLWRQTRRIPTLSFDAPPPHDAPVDPHRLVPAPPLPAPTNGSSPRYYQIDEPRRPPKDPPFWTAYSESTVVHSAPWFRTKTKECRETCCAETVAVSLDGDDRRIISTFDGIELADTALRAHRTTMHWVVHASTLRAELVPCLQRGTIVYADKYDGLLRRWFDDYRPNVSVPYVLIEGETDGPSPSQSYRNRIREDGLLLHWYGNNPRNVPAELRRKFTGMNLGLARFHHQMPYLTHYLSLTDYANPFAGDAKKRWTESKILAEADDTTHVLFVRFAVNKNSRSRRDPLRMACGDRIARPWDNVTCNVSPDPDVPGEAFGIHETYGAASRYLFGLSPPGAGMECFRTYELLLLGVIPVVRYDDGYADLLGGLPHVQLRHWNYSQKGLLRVLRNYVASDAFRKNDFDGWEKLFLRYWRRRMLKQTGRDKDIVHDEHGREYYQAWHYTLHKKPIVSKNYPPEMD